MNARFTRWMANLTQYIFQSVSLHTGVRLLISIGVILRISTNSPRNVEDKLPSFLVVAIFIFYSVFVDKYSKSSHSQFRNSFWMPIVGDTLFVSIIYFLTGSVNSELYLLYYLPILVAADNVDRKQQYLAFFIIALLFSVTSIATFWRTALRAGAVTLPNTLTFNTFLLRTFVPRALIYFLVMFVSFMRANTLKNQNEVLKAVSSNAVTISRRQDLSSRLMSIMDAAIRLLEGDGCKIYLHIPETRELVLVAIRGVDTEMLKVGDRINDNEGLAGKVFRGREAYIVDDYSTFDNRIPKLTDVFGGVIEAPLSHGDKPIGVIAVLRQRKDKLFNNSDKQALIALTPFVANAIYEARILGERNQRSDLLALLNHAGQAMNTHPNINSTCVEISKYAWLLSNQCNLANSPSLYSCVGLYDDKENTIKIMATYPTHMLSELKDRIGTKSLNDKKIGVVGRAILNRAPVSVANVDFDEDYISFNQNTHSQYAIPLLEADNVIGVISVEHPSIAVYTDVLSEYMTILANQATTAIRNAILFEKNENFHKRSLSLYDSAYHIPFSEGITLAGNRVLVELRKYLPYDRAVVQLVKNHERKIIASVNVDIETIDKYFTRSILDDELIRAVFEGRHIVYLSPPANDSRWENHSGTNDVKSWICIPLYASNEAIGIITIDFLKEYSLNDEYKIILEIFSNLIGSVLQNSVQFDQNLERVGELMLTRDKLNLVLSYYDEIENLTRIGVIFGEDMHYAKSRLGYAQTRATDIIAIQSKEIPSEVKNAANEIKENIADYLSKLSQTQQQVLKSPLYKMVNIQRLMEEVQQLKSRWISGHGISFEIYPRTRMPSIRAPEYQLRQVFLVIVQNALESLEGRRGGKISVTMEDVYYEKKAYLQVAIEDNGKGIPDNIRENIFKYKTDVVDSEHSGIGLVWVKSFLGFFDGDISFESEAGKGTTMKVLLPREFTTPTFIRKTSRDIKRGKQ